MRYCFILSFLCLLLTPESMHVPVGTRLFVLRCHASERDLVPLKLLFGTDRRSFSAISRRAFQIGPDAVIVVVDVITVIVAPAVVVDVCSIISIVARRAQPPPAAARTSTLSLYIILHLLHMYIIRICLPHVYPAVIYLLYLSLAYLSLSLLLHIMVSFITSDVLRVICSYCFGSRQPLSILISARYDSSFASTYASFW